MIWLYGWSKSLDFRNHPVSSHLIELNSAPTFIIPI